MRKILSKLSALYRKYKQTNHLVLRTRFTKDIAVCRRLDTAVTPHGLHIGGSFSLSLLDAAGIFAAAALFICGCAAVLKTALRILTRRR